MARTPLNALQAILIRERLILYFQTKKSESKKYNVREFIEIIAQSTANEGEAHAYQEHTDKEDEGGRYDSGLTLKHSTVDNLLNRRSSAISDDNLWLIRNFLLAEGYLTADALRLCGQHPDLRLRSQFGGIAPTDARLQRHRRALEGEYHNRERGNEPEAMWIAAPGRSKPFVSLRAVETTSRAGEPLHITAFSAASERYEGRLFLMPGETVALIEMRTFDKAWDGNIYRVASRGNSLELLNELKGSRSFIRTEPSGLETAGRKLRSSIQKAFAKLQSRWQACRERDRKTIQKLGRIWTLSPATERLALADKDAALIEAAKADHGYDVIRLLAQGADIDAQEPLTGRTAAHWAAANNSLGCIYALACREGDEEWVLKQHFPDVDPHGDMAQLWRAGRLKRDPMRTDHEGCFASALAPVSTDGSERNRAASDIWFYLLLSECEFVEARLRLPRSAFLDIWKPSSVMIAALELYAAPLPDGYSDPKPD